MRYKINPAERVKELMPVEEVPDTTWVEYSFNHGYERLNVRQEGSGGYEYEGAYHPDGTCEGNGICKFCGRTLHEC